MPNILSNISTKQKWALILLLLITPIGFYTKFYSGLGASWVNDSLGGVFYEIFWCLLVFLLLVNARAKVIASSVFRGTSTMASRIPGDYKKLLYWQDSSWNFFQFV